MGHLKLPSALLPAGVVLAAVVSLVGSATASSRGALLPHRLHEPAAVTPVSGPPALPEAPATIQRTFVSPTGNDANPCTVTAPCRNFTAAIANTTTGGEVIALKSGGYGAFTVPKPITIAGAPGEHVAVTGFTGTAIDVNAGSGDVVVLRNLYLTGLNGDTGIWLHSDSVLHLDSVVVTGFDLDGLDATADGSVLFVRDSSFRHNAASGVRLAGAVDAEFADSRAEGNQDGFLVVEGAHADFVRVITTRNLFQGFFIDDGDATISRSVAADNDGGGVIVENDSNVTIGRTSIVNNAFQGLDVLFGSPVARIGRSTVTGNRQFGLIQESGTLESFGDNLVRGNAQDIFGTITTVGKT